MDKSLKVDKDISAKHFTKSSKINKCYLCSTQISHLSNLTIKLNEFRPSSQTVSIDDIDSVRMGRQSEGLNKHTQPTDEERCFSIIFKGRKKNLDLMASSGEEAKQWVASLTKIISNMLSLSRQQKNEQYPCTEVPQVFEGFVTFILGENICEHDP